MEAHKPLCCLGHHQWLPGPLAQGEGISPKSGTAFVQVWQCRRSSQAKLCSVCGCTNHSNGPWRCKSDAQTCLGSHIVPSTVHQAKQGSATSCSLLLFQVFLPQGLVPPSLSIFTATGKLLRSCSGITWHKGRQLLTIRQLSTILGMDPLLRICHSPEFSGAVAGEGKLQPLFSLNSA